MPQIIQPLANYGLTDAAFAYQQGRAENLLAKYGPEKGPEIVKKLGFDKFLPSKLEDIAIGAAVGATVLGGAYALTSDRIRENLGRLVKGSASAVGEYAMPFYEALNGAFERASYNLKKGNMSRRDFGVIALASASAALATRCGGNNTTGPDIPDIPPETPPETQPGTVSGTVLTVGGVPVNSTIYFLEDTDLAPLGEGNITNGNYQNINVNNPGRVTRIRIVSDEGLNTEINSGPFMPGANQVDYRVLDRVPALSRTFNVSDSVPVNIQNPTFYDIVNREYQIGADYGLRRVEEDITFYIKRANAGGGDITPEARFRITEDVIRRIYPVITGRQFYEGETIQIVDNPPARGNGNLIVRYDAVNSKGKPRFYPKPVFNGHRITGGEAATTGPDYRDGMIDVDEIAATLFLLAESELMIPSLSNPNEIHNLHNPSEIDLDMIVASHFEALGTRRKVLADGTAIESYEPLI